MNIPRLLKFACFWMLALSLLPALVSASTNVSGSITVSTTWTAANSPYVLTGNVTVQNGATLTIQSGVQVQCGAYRIQLGYSSGSLGYLVANSAVFTGSGTQLIEVNYAGSTATLTGCSLQGGAATTYGVSAYGGAVTLNGCTASGCTYPVGIFDGADVQMTGTNNFTGCINDKVAAGGYWGVDRTWSASATLNRPYQAVGVITVRSGRTLTINANTQVHCGGYRIQLGYSSSSLGYLVANSAVFTGSSTQLIEVDYAGSTATLTGCTLQGGAATTYGVSAYGGAVTLNGCTASGCTYPVGIFDGADVQMTGTNNFTGCINDKVAAGGYWGVDRTWSASATLNRPYQEVGVITVRSGRTLTINANTQVHCGAYRIQLGYSSSSLGYLVANSAVFTGSSTQLIEVDYAGSMATLTGCSLQGGAATTYGISAYGGAVTLNGCTASGCTYPVGIFDGADVQMTGTNNFTGCTNDKVAASGYWDVARIWSASATLNRPYQAVGVITVRSGRTLTINANTQVHCGAYRIQLGYSSSSLGYLVANSAVFTGSSTQLIEVDYAGSTATLTGCTLQGGAATTYGVSAYGGAVTLNGCTASGCTYPVGIFNGADVQMTGTNNFTGCTNDKVAAGGYWDVARIWSASATLNRPYRAVGVITVRSGRTLTINANTQVHCGAYRIQLGYSSSSLGYLVANSAVFTGSGTQLIEVDYAGSMATLTGCTLQGGAATTYGVSAYGGAVTLNGCTASGCTYPVGIFDGADVQMTGTNNFTGCTNDKVAASGYWDVARIWSASATLNRPYQAVGVITVRSGRTLTINANTQVHCGAYRIQLGYSSSSLGYLVANSAVFTGSGTQLIEVDYAGSTATLTGCALQGSGGTYGIRSNAGGVTLAGCTVTGFQNGLFFNGTSGAMTATNGIIRGNSAYGVTNASTTVQVHAEHNCWGSFDGPGGTGPGSGDKIAGNVNYLPYDTACATCTYTLNPVSTNNFPSAGGGGSFAVTTSSNCAWTPTTSAGWIHPDSAWMGSGTATYTLDSNTNMASRTGTINVADKTYSITQVGAQDVTLPVVTISSPTNGQTFATSSINVSGTASDPGSPSTGVALVEVRVNAGGWQTASGTTSWTAPVSLAIGANSIQARSKDGAGNYSVIKSVSVTCSDTTLPTVAISSPTNRQTFATSSINVSGTASDPGSPSTGVALVEVRVNGGGWQTASGTTSWTAPVSLANGANSIQARSKDGAGNYSVIKSVSVTVTTDPTPPALTILSPTDYQAFTNASITVTGTAKDASGIDSVTVNGVAATLNGTNWSGVINLVMGPNTITAIVIDSSANHNAATQTVHAVLAPPPPPALVSSYIAAAKLKYFDQLSDAVPTLSAPGFAFHAEVTANNTNTVTSATDQVPGGAIKTLTPTANSLEFSFSAFFTNQPALDAAYSNGVYAVSIVTLPPGTLKPSLSLTGDAYPDAPRLLNYSAAQAINAAAEFTLSWSNFVGGTANDFVSLEIEDAQEKLVFHTPGFALSNRLNGAATAVVVPAGTLVEGGSYTGRLMFVKIVARDTNSIPGAVGITGYGAQTAFNLRTAGGGLWSGATDLGGGWKWLDWFGYFNTDAAPWIYHQQHGYLYPYGTDSSSIFFWDNGKGTWWWTSATTYPYVYRFSDGAWLWYQTGSTNPRWFYNLTAAQWESW